MAQVLIPLAEAGVILRRSPAAVFSLITAGELEAHRDGKRWKVRLVDAKRLAKKLQCERATSPEPVPAA